MANKDILSKEIESWKRFKYALRQENRLLFHKMLGECRKSGYSDCFNAKGENSSAEALFLILILHQQKMINDQCSVRSYRHLPCLQVVELIGTVNATKSLLQECKEGIEKSHSF
jgi:hypothetical protein